MPNDLKDDLRTASALCEKLSLENAKLRGRLFMLTSELDKSVVEAVERVSDENQQLRERVVELETRIKDCLFWFNADGSPVDGPRFREEFDKLRALVGYDRDKVHDFSYRHKK